MIKGLFHRRVPQIAGVYLAASWGIVEFADFLVAQFSLSPAIINLVLIFLLIMLPAVVVLAWRHGAPGADHWTNVDGAVIGLNLTAAAGILFVTFGGQELGAATTIKLVEDMEGNTVERVVPKAEFRRNMLLYDFDNESGDPDLDWLKTGVTVGVLIDLVQDVFVTAVPSADPTVLERLREAGFEASDEIPLSLKREAAELRSLPYFMDGSFRSDGGILDVQTRLYDTQSARQLAIHSYRGADPLDLVDAISLDLRHDLGIPSWQIEAAVDLPASELLTSSPEAYRTWVEGQKAFIRNDHITARIKSEEAIALDSTFAYAYANGGIAALLSGDPVAGGELISAANRYLYRLPERSRLGIQVVEKWLFQQDPEGALRAARYWTEVYPQDADARRLAATLATVTGDQDEATRQSRALLAIDTTDAQSMRQMAVAFQQRREYDSALVYYERLGDRLPSDIQTRLQIAATRSSLGQFEEARAELEQASVAAPADPDPVNQLARLDIREGLYADASTRSESVVQLARTPQERASAAGLEESLYYNRGQFARLVDAYRRRLAAQTESQPAIAVVGSMDNSEALRFASEAGRGDWALQQIDSLGSLVGPPFSLELEVAAVRIHLQRGDLESARGSLAGLQQMAESFATSPGAESFRTWVEGRIAELEDGNCTRALEKYDEAAASTPLGILYRISRMRCLASLERWQDAQAEAEWLFERRPGSPKLRLAIARYHIARGQTDEAVTHLEAAVGFWSEADPDYIPAQEARALLEELRGS